MNEPRTNHPGTADLLAWIAGEGDERLGLHVASCRRCRRTVDEWRTLGPALGEALREEADRAFTPERLDRQRARIMEQIRRGRRARVLEFPLTAAANGGRRLLRPDVRRWTAAAALAGMLIGTLAGRFLLDPRLPRQATVADAGQAGARPVLTGASGADEAFLLELDAAVFSSSPSALRALDALTPVADR